MRATAHGPGETGEGSVVEVSIEAPPDPRWHRFAMRLALGESVTAAASRAGVSRSLGYEWNALPQVQRLVQHYGEMAATQARRELAGLTRQAVRTIREVLKDASAKGSPTRLEAAKLVLNWNHIDVLPVANVERRILTYVPRGDREPAEIAVPEDVIEARGLEAPVDLPVTPTPDGLPPDFPRLADGAVDLAKVQDFRDLERLADPDYWNQEPGRRTMRHYDPRPGDRDRSYDPE